MLLTISLAGELAPKLGYLLAKHPDKCQRFDLNFGQAYVFYPEASERRCTAALLLDLDPVGLVRGRGEAPTIAHYVNDRAYVASSFFSVALGQVFRSALAGRCREFPELVAAELPLEAHVAAIRCRGGAALARRLFEPLGYTLELAHAELDPRFPEWGQSPYVALTLRGQRRLSELLSHLYVLMPVLDGGKHYYVGEDEIDKLIDHGASWLSSHPERELITSRYLKRNQRLTREALVRLTTQDGASPEPAEPAPEQQEPTLEPPLSLDQRRVEAVCATLLRLQAKTVLDLGCGEGKLLRRLRAEPELTRLVGVDVSSRALEVAHRKLRLGSSRDSERLALLHGSVVYRDARFAGFDAICLVEVIEHLELDRVPWLERSVFEFARPAHVVLTTPNRDYNACFEQLPAGRLRHHDHRFEWTRSEFADWASGVARRFGYDVRFASIGDEHPERGAPTQLAIFSRADLARSHGQASPPLTPPASLS